MDARLKRMLQQAEWADRALLGAVEKAGPASARVLAHVLAAEVIWLARLEGREWHTTPIWPEWGLAECRTRSEEVHRGLETFLERLGGDDPVVHYANQSGRSFENRASDILLHLFLHGAYHRGQIALLARQGGGEPVNTDLITLAREEIS
jgi:uncharacterized damage-inducible protein DinB